MFKSLLALTGTLALSVMALGQSSTTDPSNPNNWRITYVDDGNGRDKGISIDSNGQETTWDRPTNQSTCSANIVRLNHTASLSSSCDGSYTFTIRWIGDRQHIPSSVLVSLTSIVDYTRREDYDGIVDGSADPGLPIVDVEEGQDTVLITGAAYRRLAVERGQATTNVKGKSSITVNFTPSTYGFGVAAGGGYFGAHCAIASRALTITPNPIDTYYRSADILGNVSRYLNVVDDLNARKTTLGLAMAEDGNGDLYGSASVTGTATFIGNWVDPKSWNWSAMDLALLVGYPVPVTVTVTGTMSVTQSQLVQMAKGSAKTGGLHLTASDASGLPPMSADLTADIHAPVELVMDTEHYENDVRSAVVMNGQAVRAYLQNTGMTQSVAVTNAYAETHLPTTWVFKGAGQGAITELINLTLGIDISHPTSPQKTVTDQLTRTYIAGPSTAPGELWELRADISWIEVDSLMADYGADGFQADRVVGHVKAGSVAANGTFIKVGTGL